MRGHFRAGVAHDINDGVGAAAELVILSRERIDNDGALSTCQSPDFLTSASMPCQRLAIGDSGRGRVSASRPQARATAFFISKTSGRADRAMIANTPKG